MRRVGSNLRRFGAIEYMLRVASHLAWLNFALFLVVASGRLAEAQFSGPAPGPTTVVNPPVTITTDPAILYPAHRDVYLGVEDLISVHIYGSLDYNPTARVSQDGTLQLPLIGTVQVEGLTLHQAQELIAQKLVSAGMYRDPQVSIQIMDSPNLIATVVGELHGVVPIVGERRLYDVLAAVGGGGGRWGGLGGGLMVFAARSSSFASSADRTCTAWPPTTSIENFAAMSALLNLNSSIAALAMLGANAATATTAAASNVLFILHPLDERSERSRGLIKAPSGARLPGTAKVLLSRANWASTGRIRP